MAAPYNAKRSMRKACASLEMIKWENLPGSLNEVVDIGKVVSGSIIVTGKDVSENHIKHLSRLGALAKYKTIHFATHGLAIQDAPELSALVLSQFSEEVKGEDGYLKVDEIQHLNIKANSFVSLLLSKCAKFLQPVPDFLLSDLIDALHF